MHAPLREFADWLNNLPARHPVRALAATVQVQFHPSLGRFNVYADDATTRHSSTSLAALKAYLLAEAQRRRRAVALHEA